MTVLQEWTRTGDGQRTISQLFNAFQSPLTPEALALALADMILLWALDPLAQLSGPQALPSNVSDLERLLSQPNLLNESYNLLIDLFASFDQAVEGLEAKVSTPIKEFLGDLAFNVRLKS